MQRFKSSRLLLVLGLIAPVCAFSANYCVKVNGGFGNGGTSFIGKGFAIPAAGLCKPWAGFIKTATSVIANGTGAGCLSTDGKVLTLSIFSTNPSFFGTGGFGTDQIRLCPPGVTSCPIGGGQDSGTFGPGPAASQTCTTALLRLPAVHD